MPAEQHPPAPTCYDDVSELVGRIDGWMTPAQGQRLYAAAERVVPPGLIVEIGSFRGKSTVVLAAAAAPGVQVVAIDPHAGNDRGPQEITGYETEAAGDHEVFVANLRVAGVHERVRHVRAFSNDAHAEVDGSIELLYVDGAHRYAPARADLRDWGARVTDGGTMLVHDAFSSIGVTAAILRQLTFGSRFGYVGRTRSLAEFRADPSPTVVGRLVSTGRIAVQLPWFVRNVALKLALTLGLGRLLERFGRRAPEWPY